MSGDGQAREGQSRFFDGLAGGWMDGWTVAGWKTANGCVFVGFCVVRRVLRGE